VRSNLVRISQIVTPVVNPRLVKVMMASDGYPALVTLSSAVPGFVGFNEDGVPVDSDGRVILVADLTTVAGDGLPGNMTVKGERLIDVNGDGIADNVDLVEMGKKMQIDLDGDNKPDLDVDGDGILDSDFNGDGFPDSVVVDTTTAQTVVFIRYRATDGSIKKVPLAEAGFVKVAWSNDASQLYVSWSQSTGGVSGLGYSVAVGESFNELTKITKSYVDGTRVNSNSRRISNLSLQPAAVVRLDNELAAGTSTGTAITVDADIPKSFPDTARIYVGMEMIQVRKTGSRAFTVIQRGANNSIPQFHPKGTPVSDTAYTVAIRVSSGSTVASEKPLMLYRIDTDAPSSPSSVKSGGAGTSSEGAFGFGAPGLQGAAVAPSGIFPVSWSPASDLTSGVLQYEIQERVDNDPVWRTAAVIPAKTADGALVTNYTVGGDPRNPMEKPRSKGKFYSYRIRAFDSAGTPSSWAAAAAPTFVGSLSDLETISN
jgi:hypothetical protein